MADAGAIYRHIKAAKALKAAGNKLAHLVIRPHIGSHKPGFVALGAEGVLQLLTASIGQSAKHHLRPFGRKGADHIGTNARTAAGH
ncbi:hypothetical protein JCM17843_03280 [Kordiimonadales bacterium JCM 17843]|nr:hypothetical protein JCM17843_03280 [Kordiimonadales bacterium JCM 17843]